MAEIRALSIKFEQRLLDRIEDYRSRQRPIPPRVDAIKTLLNAALDAAGIPADTDAVAERPPA